MTFPSQPDEVTLVRAAQTGDIAAFGELVNRHHASVRACLAARMNQSDEAEDLAQETLIIAFRKLPTIDSTLPLGPWLRGIAMNLLSNHRRKFRAMPVGLNEELQLLIDTNIEAMPGANRESDQMQALRECLATLDGPARQLIKERYAERADLNELAARLGRKTSAISMQLHRLRSLLAGCIQQKLATS